MSNYSHALVTCVKIKDYHQSLSIGQLTGCCHPSFLRVLVFNHYYGIFADAGGPPSGKGRNIVGDDVSKALKEISEADTVYIPSSDQAGGSLRTVESAIELVNKFINL